MWPHRQQPTRLRRPWDSPGKNTGVGCHVLLQCMKVKSQSEVAQSCPTLSDPMGCSLPGSSVHGIFQARVLEWGAIAFSRCLPHCRHILYHLSYQGVHYSYWSTIKNKCVCFKIQNCLFLRRLWDSLLIFLKIVNEEVFFLVVLRMDQNKTGM